MINALVFLFSYRLSESELVTGVPLIRCTVNLPSSPSLFSFVYCYKLMDNISVFQLLAVIIIIGAKIGQ